MLSVTERATKVLQARGKAMAHLRGMPDADVAALAELCGEDGTLAEGLGRKLDDLLATYYDRKKASVDEGD